MGKPTGFKEIARHTDSETAPLARLKDWREFKFHGAEAELRAQGRG